MAAKLRLLSALGALFAAVMVVFATDPVSGSVAGRVDLRSTFLPLTGSTTIKYPVLDTVDPSPFDPCRDIPLDVVQRAGLAYTPPTPEDALRCRFDAGNYQMSVEAFVWRTFAETLPPDAVQLDIAGHRAAQYWIMKPTDWNNRWWITCALAFDTSYGVIQQVLFYSPVYSQPDVDCMQTNLQKAQELAPHYIY